MGGGVFAGRADIKQLGGLAGGEAALQFARVDGGFGWCCVHNRGIII
jgi:hypothetical protein